MRAYSPLHHVSCMQFLVFLHVIQQEILCDVNLSYSCNYRTVLASVVPRSVEHLCGSHLVRRDLLPVSLTLPFVEVLVFDVFQSRLEYLPQWI